MAVNDAHLSTVEINFLCVHKKLRHKRLAPVLIKEITRRVNLCDIWQAVYTAGVVLPKPVASTQYWHRSLNPRKLISVGFSRLAQRMTMARTLKLFKLPDAPATPGMREMRDADVPQVSGRRGRGKRRMSLGRPSGSRTRACPGWAVPMLLPAFVVPWGVALVLCAMRAARALGQTALPALHSHATHQPRPLPPRSRYCWRGTSPSSGWRRCCARTRCGTG